MFGCYGIITFCCKSYHKATVKFSSNPTISFSSKSTRKDPPVKSDQNKAISVHVLWVSFHQAKYPRVVKQPPKNLTFSTTSVLLLLNVPLSLSRGTVFRRQKNPRRGYRPKIAGILFVCNEPEGKYYTVPFYLLYVMIARAATPDVFRLRKRSYKNAQRSRKMTDN